MTPAEITAHLVGTYEQPGEAVFPESIGVDAATGDAYVGSLADGTLYKLTAGQAELRGAGGQDGRGPVAGVKVDDRGRLWAAAGGYDGTLRVYDLRTRELLARLATGAQPSLVNDIAFGPRGDAYVTDSLVPASFATWSPWSTSPMTARQAASPGC
jgi:sugar lactone lactonase YvrE